MEKSKINANPSLLEAIMIHLKGGDEKKVLRFTERLKKYYASQIAAREVLISKYKDQLEDAKEAMEESKVSIDLSAISEASNLDEYCSSYVGKLSSKRKEIESIEASIKSEEEKISILAELRDFNFKK